ncbi:hypothetical protein Tco_1113292 [Tanacetum coccineum]|uniref:Uncharacterized protein n=1 Tax=Tanacetum coccineum TaxID=301880 RepID=A0ABQ5IVI4_9ASTR
MNLKALVPREGHSHKRVKERIKSYVEKWNEDKIKKDLEEIETINIELDHMESKLNAENDHFETTYKQPLILDLRNQHVFESKNKWYAKLIQELLTHISKTCPSVNNTDGKLVAVTPKNKDKRVRFTEPVTSSGNTITKTASTSNLVSNKPMLSSTGVKQSTSACGPQPSGNTKKDKNRQTPSSTQKNKVEAHPRKVESSLKNKDCVVKPKGTAHMQHSKLNANSELKWKIARNKSKSVKQSSKRKVWKPTGKVFTNIRYIWRPTGRTFTIVGNACPLTRITTTTEVPLRKPTALENETPKPVVTLVYSRKPRKSKTNVPVIKSKVVQIVLLVNESNSEMNTLQIFGINGDYQIRTVYNLKGLLCGTFEVVAPIHVVAPVLDVSTGSPSSTNVDQDAPSPSNSQTTPKTQPPIIPNDVEEDNHDIKVAHMGNDPYFGIPIPEVHSDQSLSSDIIHKIVHLDHQISEHNSKWTKDHPLENIIKELARPVSTRLQLHEQALFCYYDAFLTAVEPDV